MLIGGRCRHYGRKLTKSFLCFFEFHRIVSAGKMVGRTESPPPPPPKPVSYNIIYYQIRAKSALGADTIIRGAGFCRMRWHVRQNAED